MGPGPSDSSASRTSQPEAAPGLPASGGAAPVQQPETLARQQVPQIARPGQTVRRQVGRRYLAPADGRAGYCYPTHRSAGSPLFLCPPGGSPLLPPLTPAPYWIVVQFSQLLSCAALVSANGESVDPTIVDKAGLPAEQCPCPAPVASINSLPPSVSSSPRSRRVWPGSPSSGRKVARVREPSRRKNRQVSPFESRSSL